MFYYRLEKDPDLGALAEILNLCPVPDTREVGDDDTTFMEDVDTPNLLEVEWKEDEEHTQPLKPEKNYENIVTEAIKNSEHQSLTLEAIVQYVYQTYPYFEQLPPKDWKGVKLKMQEQLLYSKAFEKVRSPDGALRWTLKTLRDTTIKDEPNEEDDPLLGCQESQDNPKDANVPTYTLADGVYTCSQCQAQLSSRHKIRRHLLSHVTVKCDVCDFKTHSKLGMAMHKKSHQSQGERNKKKNSVSKV